MQRHLGDEYLIHVLDFEVRDEKRLFDCPSCFGSGEAQSLSKNSGHAVLVALFHFFTRWKQSIRQGSSQSTSPRSAGLP